MGSPGLRVLARRLSFALLLLLLGAAPPADAQNPPSCKGRDLLAELAVTDPALHARVLEEAKEVENTGAVLWKIEGKAGKVSHLFGTIHVTDERVGRLPAAADAAIAASGTLALELDNLDPAAMALAFARLGNLVVYGSGDSLKAHLDAAELDIVKRALKQVGMPGEMAVLARPWLVTLLLAMPECERRRATSGLVSLDQRLLKDGRQRGARIVGLETVDDQLKAMAAVPEADQLLILRSSLKLIDRIDDMFETVIRRYLERRLGVVMPLQRAWTEKTGFPASSHDAFEREVVVKRNQRMRDKALPLIEAGGAFIAVGALHLPGRNGLVALLREAGYTVTAID